MFTQTAAFYDAIYAARGKDYRAEADSIAAWIRSKAPQAATLLDVGCGTGGHLAEFERLGFAVRGVDADLKMVALARSRCPEVRIDPADMTTLALDERFDAIVSLFGTTAYARIPERLETTIERLAEHLADGGVLVVEAFLDFHEFRPGHLDAVFVDRPDLKIARMSLSKQMGKIAILDFHYLVATLQGVERLFERHELGLFDDAAYRKAFENAGLTFERLDVTVSFDRRLYAGRKHP
ncbi:MAG: class I SAM-dependent methyltransferase [Candidatus Eremiobacteraeota bacterium]|nr:class I SAM-dependent methyltransferase [Candidatus Eremiobacteraeota bacterium]